MDETYHVSIVVPIVHYCMGGISISENGEVINSQSQPISGLYAAGEVTGGVHGENRLGGNALLECVVIGRVAGRSASKQLLRSAISTVSANKVSGALNRMNTIRNHLNADKEFSKEEIAKHNKDGDCWLIIWDQVYDVSKFMADHPGGKDAILQFGGQDATEQFDLIHQDTVLKRYGPQMRIGKLKGAKTANKLSGNNTANFVKLQPSETQSRISGGTTGVLPKERAKASFNVENMINFLNGGKELTKRRKFIEKAISDNPDDYTKKNNFTREDHLREGVREFISYHKAFANFKPTRKDIYFMSASSYGGGALNNSHSIFLLTVVGQGSEEQQKYWGPKILSFQICGAYAQTELGHGSNVRGLQTTATYDPKSQEFIMNTPTLQSIKWWPGCLGKVGTHATVYAQLILDGKEIGIHVFMMQIRDENHKPLPGITLGDLGNKMGDNGNDTGFMILENVRIPRSHMLCKYVRVTPEGKYEQVLKVDSKIHYFTMMSTRAMMVGVSGARLAQAATISIRYSAVRQQGFIDNKAGVSYTTPEYQIIDYKIQQYRLFKQLAHAYAIQFTGSWMMDEVTKLETSSVGNIVTKGDGLKEIASTSAGLKSLCTLIAVTVLKIAENAVVVMDIY